MMTMLSLLFVLMWRDMEGALASQGELIYGLVILGKMTWLLNVYHWLNVIRVLKMR